MKKKIALTALLSIAVASLAFGQAKKPTLMVVPSDQWCYQNGYVIEFDNQGTIEYVPDYKTALLKDQNIRILIAKMNDIMAKRDFPMVSLEQEMRKIANDDVDRSLRTSSSGSSIAESPTDRLARTAKADIMIDLSFDVKRNGPRNQVSFLINAFDAYTSKVISSPPALSSNSTAPLELLLEEGVLNFMDDFTTSLQRHFDNMFAQGREVRVTMLKYDNSPIGFETEFEIYDQIAELAEIIGVWFDDNCVDGRYNMSYKSDNEVRFDQVRMPLYTKNLAGREVASDMTSFTRSLVNMLRREPYNLPVQTVPKGLGEIIIIIGDK